MKTKILIVLSIMLMVSSCKKDTDLGKGYIDVIDGCVFMGDEFLFDFENNSLSGWKNIDADKDGYVWSVASDVMADPPVGHNKSHDYVTSQSYTNSNGGIVLYPDNYLVTESKYAIGYNTVLEFWASAQDPEWPKEHFGVAISTLDNPTPDNLTMVAEWTLEAKSGTGMRGAVRGGAKGDEINWYKYTVDLKEYAGEEVYIAIRHFNCYDQYMLNVDDIKLRTR